jgi:Fur family peroxide stress response transcriptional regulator
MIIVTIIIKIKLIPMRKSKQKEAILKVLQGAVCHPDAGWIYEKVKKQIPDISLGTIYRNLKLLKEAGAIREVGLSGGISHFESEIQPHYHFRCEDCGRIFDLDEKVDRSLANRVEKKTGFKVTGQNLELSGLCLKCQESRNNSLKINNIVKES